MDALAPPWATRASTNSGAVVTSAKAAQLPARTPMPARKPRREPSVVEHRRSAAGRAAKYATGKAAKTCDQRCMAGRKGRGFLANHLETLMIRISRKLKIVLVFFFLQWHERTLHEC